MLSHKQKGFSKKNMDMNDNTVRLIAEKPKHVSEVVKPLSKVNAEILGRLLAGEEISPELLSKAKIGKGVSTKVSMAIVMLRGAPDTQDKTLRQLILHSFTKGN